MKFAITATCVLSAAVALALCGQSHAEEPNSKPSYCTGPGAYRLSECGQLTAQQMIDAEAKATLGGRPRYAAPPTIAGSSMAKAGASDLPVYAVKKWCDTVARSAGPRSELIYGGCIDQEQSAYNGLKPSWGALPEQTQRWCDQVATSGGSGSYMILQGCVQQETSAREENSRREFRR